MKNIIFTINLIILLGCGNYRNNETIPEKWNTGIEGQRIADLGNNYYKNPVLAGDYPDPSVLKDGNDYYMVHSSFDYLPGLLIWHSKDLVNWEPVICALFKNVGSVWAPDICKYKGKYYIYFPARLGEYKSNYVVTAESITGPWSDPVDLGSVLIDPGHIADTNGQRYIFLSSGRVAPISEDGLSITGKIQRIYKGFKYPDDWIVESFSQEGPKMLYKDGYYYMVLAEGGTSGPATSHMVVAARSKNIMGPYENYPGNPVVKTWNKDEYWWSKGHATLVEGPDKNWYLMYHGYENGHNNLGRQTLLEPVEWTADGWFKTLDELNMSEAIKCPGKSKIKHGQALSDDFTSNKMGKQWRFFKEYDINRFEYKDGNLIIKGKGQSPKDCSPLAFVCGDLNYQVEVEMDITGEAHGGLLLFYNEEAYAGFGFSKNNKILHRCGMDHFIENKPVDHVFIRLTNIDNICSIYYSYDGKNWERFDKRLDVSGYNHNTFYYFLSLRPALYAAGNGKIVFKDFKYKAI